MHIRLTALALAVALCSSGAMAQDNPPPVRNGNVYDGTAHEPKPGAVTSRENAAGVALPPAQNRAANGQVEQLDKTVQKGPGSAGPAKSLACSTVPATCQ